jgi:hypothetical protein
MLFGLEQPRIRTLPGTQATDKERASTAECVNANARKNGLTEFVTGGLTKALASALLVALTHNCARVIALGFV